MKSITMTDYTTDNFTHLMIFTSDFKLLLKFTFDIFIRT